MEAKDFDPDVTTAQAIQELSETLYGETEKLVDPIHEVADAIEKVFGRDHGDIGFVGEIANALISIGSALNRLATVAEKKLGLS